MATPNTLGLDFEQLKVQDSEETDHLKLAPQNESTPADESSHFEQEKIGDGPQNKEKKKPYVNVERVRTGGNQRDKLSDEALAERMARMKEQNEKIKQRRMDVQADEEAFRNTEKLERAKVTQTRKVQDNVDRAREQNAKRKLDKIQSREWDSGKPAGGWKHQQKKGDDGAPSAGDDQADNIAVHETAPSPRVAGMSFRGNARGNRQASRGRGRGRGNSTLSTTITTMAQEVDTLADAQIIDSDIAQNILKPAKEVS